MTHKSPTERLIETIIGTVTHIIACYLGAGILAASLTGAAIPALNWVGKAYIIAAWPRLIHCAPVESKCDPMPPEWMNPYIFNFDEATK